jgi:hypothetical protein
MAVVNVFFLFIILHTGTPRTPYEGEVRSIPYSTLEQCRSHFIEPGEEIIAQTCLEVPVPVKERES